MRPRPTLTALALTLANAWAGYPFAHAGDGPATPRLKVPPGFEARLLVAVPQIEFPLQIATAPDGTLFIAEDPMDQVGPFDANDGVILSLRDGQVTGVFAKGLRAVQGMAWHNGALYVCHMPFLSVLKDADGDGQAESRTDLFQDLGPTDNRGLNDHIVSGIQFGIDGRLYISVGDKGVPKAQGPDGRKLTLKGGGTLRCKADGTDLEIFSSGTRNHLEANLNARDDVFTYDNTDDGDGWWTRVTHHVDGGYYGYPFDYHDHHDRFLAPMAEYGGGSPCGAAFYEEDAWPESWRGIGFWAEWGKGKVHAFRFAPNGSSYKIAETIDFARPDGDLDFRPIDLAFSHDGKTLYVADWGVGGWSKNEKLGRVFAITYNGPPIPTRPRGHDADSLADQVKQLDHPALAERMRAQQALIRRGAEALPATLAALADPSTPPLALRHLVWVVDGIAGGTPEGDISLIAALKLPSAEARAQTARALGERSCKAALDALIADLDDPDPTARLQVVNALGRLGDPAAAQALLPILANPDRFVAFTARQALRRLGDWNAVGRGLDSADPKIRAGALATLEGIEAGPAVEQLARVAADPSRPSEERALALDSVALVRRKAVPWDGKWWGTRPSQSPPPARVADWAGTPTASKAIHAALADSAAPLRRAAVAATRSTALTDALPTVRDLLARDTDAEVRRLAAETLGALNDRDALPVLVKAIGDDATPGPAREAASSAIEAIRDPAAVSGLLAILARKNLPPDRRVRLTGTLGALKAPAAAPMLVAALDDSNPATRAASAAALGRIGVREDVAPALRARIADPDLAVRKAAIAASASLGDRDAVPPLIAAADAEPTRFEALTALATLPDLRALPAYLRALADKSPELRKAAASAMTKLRDDAAPELDRLAARGELPPGAIPELRRVYLEPGSLIHWKLAGPVPFAAMPDIQDGGAIDFARPLPGLDGKLTSWKEVNAGEHGFVNLNEHFSGNDRAAFAAVEIPTNAPRTASFAVGSDDTLKVWLNGKLVHHFDGNRSFEPASDHFEAPLVAGPNHLVLACGNGSASWGFSVAVSSANDTFAFLKGPSPGAFDPAAFRAFALEAKGDPTHGQALFADTKGLACVKCHAVGGQGGAVGPDLSAIGGTYPRAELITSVLEPSARIFSGYEPLIVATNDGRVLTGIVKSDTPDGLEIEDADAHRIRLNRDEIDDRKTSTVSLMPVGLVEGLTNQDFADLIAYLESLKTPPPAKSP